MSRSRTQPDAGTKSCRGCRQTWPQLTRRGLCYECVLSQEGHKPTELQHPFGRDNPPVRKVVVVIPGNWHRVFDAHRAQLPENLRCPGENPLHQIAAVVAALAKAADAVADVARTQGWPEWTFNLAETFASTAMSAVDWLMILAGKLDEWHGPAWIDEMPEWQP